MYQCCCCCCFLNRHLKSSFYETLNAQSTFNIQRHISLSHSPGPGPNCILIQFDYRSLNGTWDKGMKWESKTIYKQREKRCLSFTRCQSWKKPTLSEAWSPSTTPSPGNKLCSVPFSLLLEVTSVLSDLTFQNFSLFLAWNLSPCSFLPLVSSLSKHRPCLQLYSMKYLQRSEDTNHFSLVISRLTIIPLTKKGKVAKTGALYMHTYNLDSGPIPGPSPHFGLVNHSLFYYYLVVQSFPQDCGL